MIDYQLFLLGGWQEQYPHLKYQLPKVKVTGRTTRPYVCMCVYLLNDKGGTGSDTQMNRRQLYVLERVASEWGREGGASGGRLSAPRWANGFL